MRLYVSMRARRAAGVGDVYVMAFWKEWSQPGEQMLMSVICGSKSLATTCSKSARRNESLSETTWEKGGKKTEQGELFFSPSFMSETEKDDIVFCVLLLCVFRRASSGPWHSAGRQAPLSGERHGDKVKHGREESEPRLKPNVDNNNK